MTQDRDDSAPCHSVSDHNKNTTPRRTRGFTFTKKRVCFASMLVFVYVLVLMLRLNMMLRPQKSGHEHHERHLPVLRPHRLDVEQILGELHHVAAE